MRRVRDFRVEGSTWWCVDLLEEGALRVGDVGFYGVFTLTRGGGVYGGVDSVQSTNSAAEMITGHSTSTVDMHRTHARKKSIFFNCSPKVHKNHHFCLLVAGQTPSTHKPNALTTASLPKGGSRQTTLCRQPESAALSYRISDPRRNRRAPTHYVRWPPGGAIPGTARDKRQKHPHP